jgi:predicted ribosomally synthesized peptide with SipW-like signal peptide
MKRIALSLMTIAAVAVMATSATSAYFSDSKVVANNTFSTGTVKIGAIWNMPIAISGLYPTAVKTSEIIAVQYDGTVEGDLYYGFKHESGASVLGDVLYFKVERVDANGNHLGWINANWVQADFPYTNWTKLASGLNKGEWAYYKVHVTMDANASNTYNVIGGLTAKAGFVFYAVQENGSIPTQSPVNFTQS